MSVRAVVVAHSEALAAEGNSAALARFPGLVPVGIATSAIETERCSERADVVAIDERIPGAQEAVRRLRKRGLRVVVIGGPLLDADGEDEGVVVAVDASVDQLASALAPGIRGRNEGAARLSTREDQVLRLAAKGMAGKQIARVLGISTKTVEQHKTRAFKRLGVPNQAAAVAIVTQGGSQAWNPSTT